MNTYSWKNFKRVVSNPLIFYNHLGSIYSKKYIERKFLSNYFPNKREYITYKEEVLESGIIEDLKKKEAWYSSKCWGKTGRGYISTFGAVSYQVGIKYYSLVRKMKPKILVETGVCNGISSTFLLLAIAKNDCGKLYSIDFPEVEGKKYDDKVFWEGKKGDTIPSGKESGWVIPDYLRKNWDFIKGKSQDKLPKLLNNLESIDFFLHDSEHSYECMWFEFNLAYEFLKLEGILISDDIHWNQSFYDFSKKYNKEIIYIDESIGSIIK